MQAVNPMQVVNPMSDPTRAGFKLGVFSANADRGLTFSTVPEAWKAEWDDIAADRQKFLEWMQANVLEKSADDFAGRVANLRKTA